MIMSLFRNRNSLQREGSRGRRWRRREASKKIPVPKGTVEPIQPIGPIHTYHDAASLENAHAVTAGIVARDEQEAAAVHEQLANAQADQAAAEDELKKLQDEQNEAVEHRTEYVEKVRKAGLGHKLVRHQAITAAVGVTVAMAILFETISMSSPMALLGVLDFGGSAHAQERLGAFLALLLALGYAVVLAVLSKRAGGELKGRHYRHLIEAENADDEGAEDRPRTAHAVFADRIVGLAVVGGGGALLAASVVREAAVGILAAAGQNAVQVSWWVFLLLTLGVFIALLALGYWAANPIAKVYGEMNHGISKQGKQIDAKRRECYKDAARVDTHQKQLQMIDVRSRHEQLVQYHLTAEEIAWHGIGNPHIHGVTIDPTRIQDVINDPGKHVRDLTLPSLEDKLTAQIREIRESTTPNREQRPNESEPPDAEEHAEMPADSEPDEQSAGPDEPDEASGPLGNTEPLKLESIEAVSAANGDRATRD